MTDSSEQMKSITPWQRFMVLLGTGFGLGYSPVASGTVGSIWGVAIVLALNAFGIPPAFSVVYIAIAAALCVVAIPICDVTEKVFGKKDDGRIVADEYMTFPVCMIGLPVAPWVLVMAFLTNRFFDILKPPPAHALQRFKGGLGVVIDDVMACVYSLLANHALYYVIKNYLLS